MSIALGLIVFVAFSVEATAGFGSVMISLALGTLLWPISELLPIIVPISLGLSGYMLSRYWRAANLRLLVRLVLPLMGLGMAAGLYLVPSASPALLRLLLGIIVTGAALRGLLAMRRRGRAVAIATAAPRGASVMSLLWIATAGLVHGMIATGGPPLVYALEGVGMDKKSFRSTLAFVWFLLNLTLTIRFVTAGALATDQAKTLAMLVPVVLAAILAGEFLHSRVSERIFRASVFSLLVVAGFLLWVPSLLRLFSI